jgi:branched-subunit amino acid ABC-type transport system permease component
MGVFLCALGLSVAFGALKILNLAHGSIFMIGMYICYSVSTFFSTSNGFFVGVVAAFIGTALAGGIMEILIFRPIYRREELDQFMITFGAVFIFVDLVKLVWGTDYHSIPPPMILRGPVNIFGVIFPKYNFYLMFFALIVFVLVYFFIHKTRWGMLIRGVTVDRDMMGALGIDVPRVFTVTFMIACGLSGLGGAISGATTCVAPGIDLVVLLESFIIVVIGGIGSVPGVLIGSLLFGLGNSFGIMFIPKMAIGFPFFLMLIVLILRPFGLMGKEIK